MDAKSNLTIDDIARDLGVSKTTISRAISGKGRISAATRARVQAYIQEHNYRPNAAAKGLAVSRTYNVALVLPHSMISLDQSFVRQSMSAICEEAFQHGYNILLCLSTYNQSDPLIRTLDDRKVDGVILSRTIENDRLVDILSDRGIPFATMGSLPVRRQGIAMVEADHNQVNGCYEFTKRLLAGKDGKTALLGNDLNDIVNQNRLSGFRQACQELDMPMELTPIRIGLFDDAMCCQSVDELLTAGVRRFICMDDEICMRTISRLKEMDLQIPNDVEIASMYDDCCLSLHQPPITALHFDAAELGRIACRELLNALNGLPYNAMPRLDYEIFIRESMK